MRRARGPFANINQEVGSLVDGFDSPPYFMMTHAPTRAGRGARGQRGRPVGPLIRATSRRRRSWRPAHRLRRDVRFALDPRHKDRDLDIVCDIFNDAWADNWGFVPFTATEFRTIGHEMLMIIPPDFIQIAEMKGEPVAFIVLLPNVNEAIADLDGRLLPWGWLKLLKRLKWSYPRTARIPLMGVRRRLHHTRYGPGLALSVVEALRAPGLRVGFEDVEMSWILDSNEAMKASSRPCGTTVEALPGLREGPRRSTRVNSAATPPDRRPARHRARRRTPGWQCLARATACRPVSSSRWPDRVCIARVLQALRASHSVAGGLLVGPRPEVLAARPDLARLLAAGDFTWVAPADGPSRSAHDAARALARFPLLLTAGDHALLTPALIDDFCARAREVDADLVIGLVAHARVVAAWPDSRRTVLRFRDGPCCGANLYLLRTARALGVLRFWQAVEGDRKRPWRVARRLGWLALVRYLPVA